jgi:hypothetical protein
MSYVYSNVRINAHARNTALILWRGKISVDQATARNSHPCAAFHRRGRAVVEHVRSTCKFVTGASVLRLTCDPRAAHGRFENLIGRPHMQMLPNTCLRARHSSRSARVLHPAAYQKVSLTSVDLRHHRNRGFQQNGVYNPVVASANRRMKKCALHLPLERGRDHDSSAVGSHILRSKLHHAGPPPCRPSLWTGRSFRDGFSISEGKAEVRDPRRLLELTNE